MSRNTKAKNKVSSIQAHLKLLLMPIAEITAIKKSPNKIRNSRIKAYLCKLKIMFINPRNVTNKTMYITNVVNLNPPILIQD
jgi:hypothetical protein|tara:strand:+ start:1438 stop:1683 length:246 start_codon:yes stop_codon:yes gene_type:complete